MNELYLLCPRAMKIEEEQPKCVAKEGVGIIWLFRFMHAVLPLIRNIHKISTNHRGFKQAKAAPQWRTSGIIYCITLDT